MFTPTNSRIGGTWRKRLTASTVGLALIFTGLLGSASVASAAKPANTTKTHIVESSDSSDSTISTKPFDGSTTMSFRGGSWS